MADRFGTSQGEAADPSLITQPGGWRVLVVEGNAGDAQTLMHGLRRHGHEVTLASSGGDALRVFDDAQLILIDLDLPDLDGIEVCRRIRISCDTPMIVVTRRGSDLDPVLGLQAGADDFLIKPVNLRELIARMEAIMRRLTPQDKTADVIIHGRLRIDPTARQVTLDGKSVELTRKEFQLLHVLASQTGAVIPRKQIMAQVWGDSWSQRTLDTHMSSLRSKLGNSDWIITVRGVGFRLGRP